MTESILVAGGAGYIGSHVCKALATSGYQPVVLDNLSTGYRQFVKWGPLVEADVSDTETVGGIVKKYQIRAVIDLAGTIDVSESVTNPLKYYESNFACKIHFVRALKESGVRAFVFSSTAAVYGEPTVVPIPETHLTAPTSPYGSSKLFFESLLRDYHAAVGFPWMALRYFNAAGASADGEIGENHDPETHLIPRACLAALGYGPPLAIFGTDYPTFDGTAIRDYIHVMDLAAAHVLAIRALLDGAAPAICNLGNGRGTSVREIVTAFEHLQIPVPHEVRPRRVGDPARLVADPSSAQKILGWKPEYIDIETIIRSAYAWHKAKAGCS